MKDYDILSKQQIDTFGLDLSKNRLVSLVKADNMELYLDQAAKIYYTGKRFPSTVALNKLYYFMPYIKGRGVRDLYFIKIAVLVLAKKDSRTMTRTISGLCLKSSS